MRKFVFSVFVMMMFCAELSFGQTITLGSGNTSNGVTTASPTNIYYRRQISQMVYTAAEINAAGVTGPAVINEFGFFVSNKPIYDIPGYTISMKHTTATNAAGNLNGGYTTVVNSFTFSGVTGDWNMMTLDTPFNWDGVSNIAVQVCWSQVQPTWDPSGQVRTYAATAGYRYRRNDNAGSACGLNPNATLNTKPQVKIVFETETVWTGAASTDWFNPANWTADVPNSEMDARIPAGTPNNPLIVGLGECNNFILEGTMDMSAASRLNVYGDYSNSGTLNDNGGTTNMVGLNSNAINNSAATEFSTLTCQSKGGVTLSGAAVTIKNTLGVNRSTLNTNDLITIKSDATGTGRIDELVTNCFYSINMTDTWGDGWNGGFVEVFEDGVSIGTYASTVSNETEIIPIGNGSTVEFVYTAGQFENENAYTIFDANGTAIFNDGTNPSTGTVFTTIPSCSFTDPISGEVNVERYVDAGPTYWRQIASSVQGATLDQMDDDFATSGYPGSWWPSFWWTSVYKYDETLNSGNGYIAATTDTEVMQPGQGWHVWCGDTITGTEPFVFDFRGVPNQGDIAMSVTYTNTGVPSEDGFNLVGNPYPSTIDWDDPDWTKTNMANAVYIQNPDNQQYATYVAGASTNGGSRYIASQQSFWVQAFAASPVLTAREGVKANNDQAFFKNGNLINPGMTIRIQGDEEFDEAVLRHLEMAEEEFEHAYDANKMWGGWGEYPQLSLINNESKDLTVHSFNKGNQEWSIPLRAIVFENGIYNIEFEHLGELDVPCLQLEDLYTGNVYMVEEGVSLPFEMSDTTYAPRFVLHLGKTYQSETIPASCNGLADGEIIIDLDEPLAIDYTLTQNGIAQNLNDIANPLQISNLESGIYQVEVPSLANVCNQTVFNFVVNQPAPITVTENITDESNGNDGAIDIDVSGGVAPYSIMWDNGDNTQNLSGLVAGTYTVQIEDQNGCESEAQYTIDSELSMKELTSFSAYYANELNQVVIENAESIKLGNLKLYNQLGQVVQTFTPENSSFITIDIDAKLPQGIYILSDSAANFKLKFVK